MNRPAPPPTTERRTHTASIQFEHWDTSESVSRLAITQRNRPGAGRFQLSITGASISNSCGGSNEPTVGVLLRRYPESMSREDLAEATGYDAGGGYFTNMVSALRTLGAVRYPEPGSVAADDLLFPEGLY